MRPTNSHRTLLRQRGQRENSTLAIQTCTNAVFVHFVANLPVKRSMLGANVNRCECNSVKIQVEQTKTKISLVLSSVGSETL